MRLSKERREQLGAYGQINVPNNGLLAISDLVENFNQKEETQTTFEEMLHGLRRFASTTPKSEVKFAIYNDEYIFNKELSKKQIEDMIVNNEGTCCDEECGCEQHIPEETNIEELEGDIDQQADLIGLIAEISAPLYGVLNFQELTDIINHYHPKLNVVNDDILPALTKHIEFSGEEVDYTIFEGFIVSPLILPDANKVTDADVELIDSIRVEQKKHGRYLPDYEEFTSYITPIHEMMNQEFQNFLSFLDKNSKRLGIKEREIAEIATTFLQLLKAGMESNYFIEFFQEEGCSFNSSQFIDEFMGYVDKVYNNTRMYELNGYTLSEIGAENNSTQAPTNVLNMPTANAAQSEKDSISNQRIVTKVGRNEPCPCSSGKKYKKCCL